MKISLVADATGNNVKENKDSRMTLVIWHAQVRTMNTKTAFERVFATEKNVRKTAQLSQQRERTIPPAGRRRRRNGKEAVRVQMR